ncbi:hypothetical protein BLNAU_18301 [Blattamonas nauphoetae]|uniref:Uncharacterized protein n=1 Tax=Blattamonas nauphoetae TaxID=2049346 RepID=A0ABQ9X4R7_9EUKA|nr:hypothetical protein BLNAU_18301 [Blattamonas nauphoetae]
MPCIGIILTTLARISLFTHLLIAYNSAVALYTVVQRDPPALTLLPSPIFPSSSPHQQYSGLSFLAALSKRLRIVFSEFQANLPTDPSHLPKYAQLTNNDPFIDTCSLDFCSLSFLLPTFLLITSPPIEVDLEIIDKLILFVKEALTTILTNISNIDNLIASLPSDSSPTTRSVSEGDTQLTGSLKHLKNEYYRFQDNVWRFFVNVTFCLTDPHKSSFQTIILDDPSFPDLILNTLKLTHNYLTWHTIIAITNIVILFPWMREKFMTVNLVGRMFETVNFLSLPLSESNTLFQLTRFIVNMLTPIGDDDGAQFEQYPLIRVSVFDPAKEFITVIFHNSDKLLLDEQEQTHFESHLCWIHIKIKNMELRSDEHDADFVSELVKWEMRVMVEMENEDHFLIVFHGMLNRTWEWKRDQREREKGREVVLREEGWDDSFELRVVGIEVDTHQDIQSVARQFRIERALNVNEL